MVIEKYDENWPKQFLLMKEELERVISIPVNIEHVGSTSIPGMCAKPIIDIDIGIQDFANFNIVKSDLHRAGYEHEGDLGIAGREAFKRTGSVHNKILDEIDHHLYVCSAQNEEFKRHILFRDYLRSHDEARDMYNKIKEEILAKVGQDNRAGYVQMKEKEYQNFFEDIIKKAKNSSPIIAAFMVPHPPMIVPEVGRGSEKQIEKTISAYEKVAEQIAELKPQTIIISSPHSIMYSDYFHISPGAGAAGSFAEFGAPQVKFDIDYDEELVNLIANKAEEAGFPAGTLGERNPKLDHGTMVPLWFILKKYKDFKLVRTGLSGQDFLKHYEYGMMIKDAAKELNRRVVYIASGDLSHKLQTYGPYGFAKEGPEYDARIMDVCSGARFGELFDFDENFCEKAAECGHRSFVVMAGALDGKAIDATQYSHEDVTGVGYGICSFIPKEDDADRHFLSARLKQVEESLQKKSLSSDAYVKLARASAEFFVKYGREMELPDWVPQELLNAQAGAFVSVHKFGALRGCIGTIAATKENLAQEIIHNAVSAVSEDPRFNPVDESELKYLEINVDVLGEPERIKSPAELDVKKYGVIVQSGYKRGLLLPDLDGVDTVEQQVSIARRKGNIAPDDDIDLFRFQVVRHL